jgi:hypothetical protein
MAEKPQLALPGKVPPIELKFEDGEILEFREHSWGTADLFNMPATHYGSVKPECRHCGVVLLREGNPEAETGTVRSLWRYVDAAGVEIFSNIALSCPGPGKTLTGEAMERARRNKVEIRHTNEQVHRVEKQQYALAAAMEGRITQLEQENKALREQVGQVTQLDMKELAAHLFALAEEAKERKALESVESKGRVVQIPKELADIIDVVGVPVEAEVLEDPPGDES